MDESILEETEWTEAPPWAKELATGMGVHISRYGIVPGWLNAATDFRGTFWVGEPLLAELSADELKAVLAHEFAHPAWMATPHAEVTALIGVLMLRWAVEAIQNFHPLIILLAWQLIEAAFSAWLDLIRLVVSWNMECGADSVAAKYVGSDYLIPSLEKLGRLSPIPNERSDSHPPLSLRILMLNLFSGDIAPKASSVPQ